MARKAVAIALAAAVAVTGVPGFPGGGTKAEAAEITDARVNELNEQYFKDKEYKRVSEHDPSIVVGYINEKDYTGKEHVYGVQNDTKTRTKVYFTFGSHMAFAWSLDLQDWKLFENNINKNYNEIFKKNFEWSASGDSHYATAGNMWAPDVIWDADYVNEDGSKGAWLMYMSINGCSWNSSILLLVSDSLNGDWTPKGDIIYSGFNADTSSPYSYKKTNYEQYGELENGTLPSRFTRDSYVCKDDGHDCVSTTWNELYGAHAIDPCITYDESGKLWMSYGSWSGGIYMLEIDPVTGLRKSGTTYPYKANESDPYMGIKLAGGNMVSGEASYIEYIGNKYYMFLSYGGFAPDGGYNMRVFSSDNITGPYTDLKGKDARYGTSSTGAGNTTGTTGDRLMSYYKWSFLEDGYTAQGHNSAFVDDDGKSYVVYHNKTDDGTAGHEMRVHQLFVAENGGLVTAPFEYCGETLSSSAYNDTNVTGEYGILYMDPSYSNGNVNCVQEQTIELKTDKTVSWGNKTGTWSQDTGKPAVSIIVDGITYQGVFVEQNIEETAYKTMCFTVVGNDGVAIWGYKKADNGQPFDDEAVVAYNASNVKAQIPENVFIGNKLDFAGEGYYGAGYAWKPADTNLISADGTVQSVDTDTNTQVTLTITSGNVSYNKIIDIKILSQESKYKLLPIGKDSILAEYYTKAEANEAIGNLPSKDITKYTGLSFSMYADGLKSDWDNIFRKKDSSFQFQFATISYSKGGQWCWYYEGSAELSDYAKEMGYDNGTIWKSFADGHYYLTISFNADGSISYYRDGHLMMKYSDDLVPSNNPNNLDINILDITEDVIAEYKKGNIEFNWNVNNVVVGYGADYDPSSYNPNELKVNGRYKYNDTATIPLSDLTGEPQNQVIGTTDRKTGWWGALSDYYKLTGDFDTTFTFNNYGGSNIFNNYVMVFANASRNENYAIVRADDFGWSKDLVKFPNKTLSGNNIEYSHDWKDEAAFTDIMEAAKITANIKRTGSDIKISVTAVSLTDSNKSYTREVTFTETDKDISFFFTVDNCYLEMVSIEGLAQVGIDDSTGEVQNQIIGNTDKSTGFFGAFSDFYKLTGDFNATFTFNNYGGGAIWNNYVMVFASAARGAAGYKEYAVIRSDNYGWGGKGPDEQANKTLSDNPITYNNSLPEDATFIDIMKEAKVTANLKRNESTITVTVEAVSLKDSSKSYTRTVTFTETSDDINFFFSVDSCYLEMISAEGITQEEDDRNIASSADWSDFTTLTDDFNVTFDFDNYGSDSENYYNYLFEFRNDANDKYITMYADGLGRSQLGDDKAPDGSDVSYEGTTIINDDWATFKEIMKNAHVSMNISRNEGIVKVDADIVSKTDTSKSYKYMIAFGMLDKKINIRFTVKNAYIKMNKITYNIKETSNTTWNIQWYRTPSLDVEGTQIPDAMGESYLLQKEDADNYIYATVNDKKIIFRNKIEGRPISANVEVEDKEYDGNTNAIVKAVTFDGLVNGDNPEYTADMQFDTALPGTGKTVTGTVSLTGDWAKYYVVSNNPVETTADITGTVPDEKYTLSYTTDKDAFKNATVSIDKTELGADETAVLTIKPDTGYEFKDGNSVSVVKSSGDCTIGSQEKNSDGSYSYKISGLIGNCEVLVSAIAVAISKGYSVTYNSTISNATVQVTKDGNAFESGSSAVITDQLKLMVTPASSYTFAEAPVVKADNATVNVADVKGGIYTYYIINFKDATKITISGNTVPVQYKVSIADSADKVASANHAKLSISTSSVNAGSTVQFKITPDGGYLVKSASISTEKDTCAISGPERADNGIWIFELSKFTGDTVVNNIVFETAEAKVTESGTDTAINIGAANLGETDFSDKGIADAITSAVTNKGNINAVIDEEGNELTGNELDATITEISKAVENGSNVNVSLEVNEKIDLDTATENTAKQTLAEIEKQAAQASDRQVSASKIAMPLDISFYARIAGLEKLKVSIKDTGNKEMTIKMVVPSHIEKEANGVKRLYYVIRFHNNQKTIIPCTYNERSNNIIFKSSKFSTYILCYADTIEKKTQDSNNNNNNNYIPGPSPSATVTPAPTSPATPSPTVTPTPSPMVTPTPAPTNTPDDGQNTPQPTTSNDPSATDEPDNEEPGSNNTTVKTGTKVVVSNLKYTVTSAGSKRTVKFTGVQKKAKKVVVPASVKVSGKKYKVTAIAQNALKGNKKIQKLTIGSNIGKIGKKAFYGCSKLKSIIIKSKKLTAKNTGSKAFKGINSKATIKVPKGKVKSYKKIVCAKGAGKKVKVKKS